MVTVDVSDLTVGQTLHEILRTLQRIEGSGGADVLEDIAAQINANTENLSTLSTHPPQVPTKESTVTDPTQAVDQALAAQTQAIADLAAELAQEHEQWLVAVNAGDEEQAAAIVARVEANTAQLNQMTADLEASNPDATPDNTLPEEPPVVDNTLPAPEVK